MPDGGGGGSQPSGTTTTVQRADPWSGQQPFLKTGFEEAQRLFETGGPQYFPGSTYATPTAPMQQALNRQIMLAGGTPSVFDFQRMMALPPDQQQLLAQAPTPATNPEADAAARGAYDAARAQAQGVFVPQTTTVPDPSYTYSPRTDEYTPAGWYGEDRTWRPEQPMKTTTTSFSFPTFEEWVKANPQAGAVSAGSDPIQAAASVNTMLGPVGVSPARGNFDAFGNPIGGGPFYGGASNAFEAARLWREGGNTGPMPGFTPLGEMAPWAAQTVAGGPSATTTGYAAGGALMSPLSAASQGAALNVLDPSFRYSNPGNLGFATMANGPAMQAAVNSAVQNATPGLLDTFTRGNRLASPGAAYAVSQGITNAAAPIVLAAQQAGAQGLSQNYGQAVQQQNQANLLAPQVQQMPYTDASKLYEAGQTQQGLTQNIINDAMARYNYGQTSPFDLLNWYNSAVGGSYGGTSTLESPYFEQPGGGFGAGLSGAMGGGSLGMMVGGPWGAGIGAGIGLLGGLFG